MGVEDFMSPDQSNNVKAARNLAALVKKPSAGKIIPGPFEKGVAKAVARAMR